MKRTIYFFLVLAALTISQLSQAQSRYLVRFKNKGLNTFTLATPSAYLSQRSLDRRTRYGIALDSTDLPVTPRYIDSLRAIPTVVVLNISKWLNQVSILITNTTPANITAVQNKINSFPFVQSSSAIASRASGNIIPAGKTLETGDGSLTQRVTDMQADTLSYGASRNQIKIHNGDFLHTIGLRGQSMVIGMLDGGFQNYLTVNAFDSARTNGQILGTHDFVVNEANVNNDHPHGEQCFSIIAGNLPGQYIGTAPKASFYLFRTEDAATEYPIEEHNWVCGAERVDSAGGDVISSSLGYYSYDAPLQALGHPFSDMNGNTTMAAIGADLAAKKGVLVVNAAGNEGNNAWGRIITPADGDSVLAVGAVNISGVPGSFTSRGPSADGQVKPDVASVGVATVIANQNNGITAGNGTSYACPNIAGLATCLWQGFQEFNNMKIINALRQAGSRATNPNDTIGYGIPDVKKALLNLTKEFSTSGGSVNNCKTTVNWTSKDVADMKYEIERKAPGQTSFTKISERFGIGSIFSNHSYTTTDSLINMQAGAISYRIRQIIDTATATFSADYIDTVTVNLAASCVTTAINPVTGGINEIVLLPNPTRSSFSIKMTTTNAIQDIQVRVTDATGKLVHRSTHSKGAGMKIIPISIPQAAKGKYFVSIYGKGQLITTQELLKL
ncbi:MAG: family serine peptidase [Flaviaesturariibacter sp.]|nr:family serine peptidase [Flaviaesturariibacter sp.]